MVYPKVISFFPNIPCTTCCLSSEWVRFTFHICACTSPKLIDWSLDPFFERSNWHFPFFISDFVACCGYLSWDESIITHPMPSALHSIFKRSFCSGQIYLIPVAISHLISFLQMELSTLVYMIVLEPVDGNDICRYLCVVSVWSQNMDCILNRTLSVQ